MSLKPFLVALSAITVLGLCVVRLGAAEPARPAVIYTQANAPATPKLDDLPLKSSVSQYGITWTFEKPAHIGQFVNGDFYVVGPVTVTTIDPKPLFGAEVKTAPETNLKCTEGSYEGQYGRNGSTLNLPGISSPSKFTTRTSVSGLDSRMPMKEYDPRQFTRLPIAMKAGDSLVSSISVEPYNGYPIKAVAVLTCMGEPQPPDAFRPSFCQTATSKIYLARDLRRDLLLNLPRPARAAKMKPTDYVDWYQGPWIDMGGFGHAMPKRRYMFWGWSVASYGGATSLLLLLDYPAREKEPLLVNMVQVGIDLYGLMRGGHEWHAEGGIFSGRKWLITFAGLMLGDPKMADLRGSYPAARFDEDEQVMFCPVKYRDRTFDRGWTDSRVIWTGHFGYKDGRCFLPGQWSIGYGPVELFPPSEWPMAWPEGSEMYRRQTSGTWVGQALAAHLMHAEKLWDYDAYFAYVDRWMTEDDAPFLAGIRKNIEDRVKDETERKALLARFSQQAIRSGTICGGPPEFAAMVKELWDKYRNSPPDGAKVPPAETTWKGPPPISSDATGASHGATAPAAGRQ